MSKLAIAVLVNSKCTQDIVDAAVSTWMKRAEALQVCVVLYYDKLGGIHVSKQSKRISSVCVNAFNQASMSNSVQVFYPAVHLLSNYPAEFYCFIQMDTYVSIDQLLHVLQTQEPHTPIYIGTDSTSPVLQSIPIQFRASSVGCVISHSALSQLSLVFPMLVSDWYNMCKKDCKMASFQNTFEIGLKWMVQKICPSILVKSKHELIYQRSANEDSQEKCRSNFCMCGNVNADMMLQMWKYHSGDLEESSKTVPPIEIREESLSNNCVFVILRCVSKVEYANYWFRCYTSIRNFYPNVLIVIIDDYSIIQNEALDQSLLNTRVIASEYKGAGELLPYYYFQKFRWADTMIVLHDSMFMSRPFRDDECQLILQSKVKFLWKFTDHENDDVALIDSILVRLQKPDELRLLLPNHTKWCGCFGAASIVKWSIVEELEKQFCLWSILVKLVKTRNDRMALERVIAIALFSILKGELINDNCALFGEILEFPFNWVLKPDDTALIQTVLQFKQVYPIIKTWIGR